MKEITKAAVEQYEKIRRSGVTNMFDYFNVQRAASKSHYYALASLTKEEYAILLQNFGKLMKKYNIKQE